MWEQALPELGIRALLVNDKVLDNSVPCDDGFEVTPGTSEEPVDLGAPAAGRGFFTAERICTVGKTAACSLRRAVRCDSIPAALVSVARVGPSGAKARGSLWS
jgi:hypothetical protein